MSLVNAFGIGPGTLTIAASTASASSAYTSGGNSIRVYNNTTAIAFIRSGVGSQTAVNTDVPVAPSSVEIFTIPHTDTFVGVILSTGTGSVYVTRGEGM